MLIVCMYDTQVCVKENVWLQVYFGRSMCVSTYNMLMHVYLYLEVYGYCFHLSVQCLKALHFDYDAMHTYMNVLCIYMCSTYMHHLCIDRC